MHKFLLEEFTTYVDMKLFTLLKDITLELSIQEDICKYFNKNVINVNLLFSTIDQYMENIETFLREDSNQSLSSKDSLMVQIFLCVYLHIYFEGTKVLFFIPYLKSFIFQIFNMKGYSDSFGLPMMLTKVLEDLKTFITYKYEPKLEFMNTYNTNDGRLGWACNS